MMRVRTTTEAIMLVLSGAILATLGTAEVSARIVSHSLTATQIQAGSISGTEIAASSISSGHIQANAINSTHISSNSIDASKIVANSIDVSKLNVSTLSAITSDLGTVTAGSISLNSGAFTVSSLGALYSDHATFGPSDTNVDFLKINDGASFTGSAYVGHGEMAACFTNSGQLYPCS